MQDLSEREEQDKKYNPAEKKYGKGEHDDLGVSPEQREAETNNLENLYNTESAPESDTTTSSEAKEQSELESTNSEAENSDDVSEANDSTTEDSADDTTAQTNGGFYKPGKSNAKGKGFLKSTKSKVATIGVIVSLIGGIIGFVQAPNLIINHLREVVLGKVSELQNGQSLRHRRKFILRAKDYFSLKGRRTGKIVAEMEARGYHFKFDDSGDLKEIYKPGINPKDSARAITGEDMGIHLSDYLEKRHPLRTSRWKTKRMEAFFDRFKIPRASPIEEPESGKTPDEDPEKAVNKEIAKEVVSEEPEKVKSADVKENPHDTEAQKAEKAQAKAEQEAILEDSGIFDDARRQAIAGEELSSENKLVSQASEGVITKETVDVAENVAKGTIGTRFKNFAKSLTFSGVIGGFCTLKQKAESAITAARLIRSGKLQKYASIFIEASDLTRSGKKVDSKRMNALMRRLFQKDTDGEPLSASPGFMYMMKGQFNKVKNKKSKGRVGVDGELTGAAGGIKAAFDTPGVKQVLGDKSCTVAQSPITQIGEGVVQVGITIFSGGISEGGLTAFKESFTTAFSKFITEFSVKQIAVQVGKQAGLEVAKQLSLEAIGALIQMQIDKALSLNFTGQEKGAQLGDILGAGAGTLNKQRSLSSGMVPATTAQYTQAKLEHIAWKKEETKKQSLYTRFFDMDNPDSLAFNITSTVAFMPRDPSDMIQSASSNLASAIRNPFASLPNAFLALSPSAYAQSTDLINMGSQNINGQELATDPAGNLLSILRPDIANIDPQKNAEQLIASGDIGEDMQPKSEDFKEHIKYCVDNLDTLSVLERSDGTVKTDCTAKLQKTVQFKAHLAFLDMQDGIDADFFPDDISNGGVTSTPPTTTSTAGSTVVGDPGESSISVDCAPGTLDIGIHTGYQNNQPVEHRLCAIPNIACNNEECTPGTQWYIKNDQTGQGAEKHAIVNSRVSGIWFALATDAAASGVTIRANSSFRSMPHQQRLWNANPNPQAVARPGSSPHQSGQAIDIDLGESMSAKSGAQSCSNRMTRRGNKVWDWLLANADRYGLKQYSAEAWHWDTFNMSNRCSSTQL